MSVPIAETRYGLVAIEVELLDTGSIQLRRVFTRTSDGRRDTRPEQIYLNAGDCRDLAAALVHAAELRERAGG